MTEAAQVVAQPVLCAAERELAPRDVICRELRSFEAFVVRAQVAADRGGGIDNDDRYAPGIRVDVHQALELDDQRAFFPGLSDGSVGQRLTAVDVTTRIHPFAVTRLDRPAYEDQLVARGPDNGPDGDLRVEVEHEPAARAHRTDRLGGFQPLPLECGPATRAELVGMRVIMHAASIIPWICRS